MRDYPNMSYCMFENTMAALNQCSGAIEQALRDNEPLELNQYEHRPFNEMYEMCQAIMNLLEQHEEMVQDIKAQEAEMAEQDEG
jgi:hypothetical protein